jgi:DNA-binding SARP family transcriptional activator
MAGTCRIHLLGGFAVEVDRRPVPPRAWRRESADLVKVLALAPSHHVDQDELLSRLWPELPAPAGLKELHRAARDVCKALHDGRAVTVEGTRLRLWPLGELWVDALAFTAHAKHGRSPDHRAEALALYTGDLLPEDLDAWWTEPMRTRLRLMHLELLRDPDSGTPPWIDLRSAAVLTQG